jgi:hypothetical protein
MNLLISLNVSRIVHFAPICIDVSLLITFHETHERVIIHFLDMERIHPISIANELEVQYVVDVFSSEVSSIDRNALIGDGTMYTRNRDQASLID